MKLTLGKNENTHVITKKDRFLDNGVCIQLLKEIPMKVQHAGDSLALCKESINALNSYQKINHANHEFKQHGASCEVFSIVKNDERFLIMAYDNQDDVDNKKGFFIGGEDYYLNAVAIKDEKEGEYHLVKVFDTDIEEVAY